MSRGVTALNFCGVLALGVLSGMQWRENRRLNLEVNRLERARLGLESAVAEKEKLLRGQGSDLELLRGHVTRLGGELKSAEERRRAVELVQRDREAELAKERNEASQWKAGLEARDARIRELGEELSRMGGLVNEARTRHNELALEYKKAAELLAERTRLLNEAMNRINGAAKSGGGVAQ